MSEETDPQAEQAELVKEAWDGSYSFLGQPLAAWSHKRQRAAQRMGMIAPNWTPQDADAMRTGHSYPGHLDDVAIFFWLLSIKPRAEVAKGEQSANPWTVELAHSTPATARDAAFEHAEANGFASMNLMSTAEGKIKDPCARNWNEANEVFWSIFNGIEASKFRVETDAGDAEDGEREKKV